MSRVNILFSAKAKQLAEQLDKLDGKTDGAISASVWKDNAVKNWGAKDNVKVSISLFGAIKSIEKYMKAEAAKAGKSTDDIGEKWYSELVSISKIAGEQPVTKPADNIQDKKTELIVSEQPIYKPLAENADALNVDKTNIKTESSFVQKKDITAHLNLDPDKEKIVSSMYEKWSAKFKNSKLGKDFYSKVYDVMKVLNCSVKDVDFNSEVYSSKKEQIMDELIAIFACEAQLNPAARNGIYRGLFQLATGGLTDLKKWASKHQDVPGMKNIKNININQFARLSGVEQMDYLVAYIGKAKEYSKIPAEQSVTPGQVWAMIKYPFKGQLHSNITAQKNSAIQRVFKNSNIQQGTKA